MNYITTTEFKDYNPETDFTSYTDAVISGMISRASAMVDSYLNQSLGLEVITQERQEATITSDADLVIHTRKKPIISLQGVKIVLGSYSFEFTLTDDDGTKRYDIPTSGEYILIPAYQISGQGYLTVKVYLQMKDREVFTETDYTAGYETIPDDIKDAVNLWTKHIFMRQANPMGLRDTSQGNIRMAYSNGGMIKEAKAILSKYRRVTPS